MNVQIDTASLQAAALHLGLLVFVMLGLKIYVGYQRGRLKVEPGDLSNVVFGRAARVQLNAVEDVPPLMIGLLALALFSAPAWFIHACGGTLVVSRILHAVGLASSSGFSAGRSIGTLGTFLVSLAVGAHLVAAAFGFLL
jgi:hypothetical protein